MKAVLQLGFISTLTLSSFSFTTNIDFIREFKSSLESDLQKEQDMSKLIEKLQFWIGRCKRLCDAFPKLSHLEDTSTLLSEFQNSSIEIPGQYLEDIDPSPDHHIRLDRFHTELIILNDHQKCIQLRGNNGKLYPFAVKMLPNIPNLFQDDHQEERIAQLFRLLSRFVIKHKETRKRNLYFNLPNITTIAPRIHLVQTEFDYISLSQLYEEHHSLSRKEEFYSSIDTYRKYFQSLIAIGNDPSSPEVLMEAFTYLCNITPDNILSKYVKSVIPSYSHLFTFKKQFTNQLALTSLIGYIMGIGNREPRNIRFSKSTGNLLHLEFYPAFDLEGIVKCSDAVPFRLTRNLKTFLNPIYADGIFGSSMIGAALCFAHYKEHLQNHLSLFIRDSLIVWQPIEVLDGSNKAVDLERRKHFEQSIEQSVSQIMDRITSLVMETTDSYNLTVPLDKSVNELIESAQSNTRLSQMIPSWMSWL